MGSVWISSVPLGLLLSAACCGRGGYRPYFENYTVDASILKMIRMDHF